jgi:hypothetical protein
MMGADAGFHPIKHGGQLASPASICSRRQRAFSTAALCASAPLAV